MTGKAGATCVLTILWIVALTASAAAQKGKGKPPQESASLPGTLTFRCQAVGCADGIIGLDSPYGGVGEAETGNGAHLNANGELWLGLGLETVAGIPITYAIAFDFSAPDGVPPCQGDGSCRLIGTGGWTLVVSAADGELQSNALDQSGAPVSNGLLALPVGMPSRSRLKIGFTDPDGRNLAWWLNFNTIDYAGATDVDVVRTSACEWVFSADVNDRAGLSAFGNDGHGKKYRTDEGLYSLPFEMAFTVPALCDSHG